MVFYPEDTRLPYSVELIDDELPEDVETFNLFLATLATQRGLSLGVSSTTVYIEDDDSTLIVRYYIINLAKTFNLFYYNIH